MVASLDILSEQGLNAGLLEFDVDPLDLPRGSKRLRPFGYIDDLQDPSVLRLRCAISARGEQQHHEEYYQSRNDDMLRALFSFFHGNLPEREGDVLYLRLGREAFRTGRGEDARLPPQNVRLFFVQNRNPVFARNEEAGQR